MNPAAIVQASPQRAVLAQSVGVNLAASAAFYLVTSDRRHWPAATAVGVLGVWLWRAGAQAAR